MNRLLVVMAATVAALAIVPLAAATEPVIQPINLQSAVAAAAPLGGATLFASMPRATELGALNFSGAAAEVTTAAFSTPTAIDLGTLGGTRSEAVAVNAAGQVVGHSLLAGDADTHAFSWTKQGGMVDLGTLGGTFSDAHAVNAAGLVVGESTIAGDAEEHAYSWTQAGGMVDLGTLGGTFSRAIAVNEARQVVGVSTTADNARHATLWQPQAGGPAG